MTGTLLSPVEFAAGVYLLSRDQAEELAAITDRLPDDLARIVEASAYVRFHVDAEALRQTATRIRRGELRVPLYDVEDGSVIRTPVQ